MGFADEAYFKDYDFNARRHPDDADEDHPAPAAISSILSNPVKNEPSEPNEPVQPKKSEKPTCLWCKCTPEFRQSVLAACFKLNTNADALITEAIKRYLAAKNMPI